jgi:hypothetical protein
MLFPGCVVNFFNAGVVHTLFVNVGRIGCRMRPKAHALTYPCRFLSMSKGDLILRVIVEFLLTDHLTDLLLILVRKSCLKFDSFMLKCTIIHVSVSLHVCTCSKDIIKREK